MIVFERLPGADQIPCATTTCFLSMIDPKQTFGPSVTAEKKISKYSQRVHEHHFADRVKRIFRSYPKSLRPSISCSIGGEKGKSFRELPDR